MLGILFFSGCALGTRKFLWFGHGCSCHRARLEHERFYDLGMDALESVGNAEHKRSHGLGMDALETVGDAERQRYYGLGMDALESSCDAEARQLPEKQYSRVPEA